MKILFIPLLLTFSLPAFAEVDSKIHKLCSDTKDYLGCVKAQSSDSELQTPAGGKAKAKTKEIYVNLSNFNEKQYFLENPGMYEWAKANPKLAKNKIDDQFLFFRVEEFSKWKKDENLYTNCLTRGTGITPDLPWKSICESIKGNSPVTTINQSLYSSITKEIKKREEREIAEERCNLQDKKMRSTTDGRVCMNDYEFATYKEQQRKRIAEEAHRELMAQQEAERERQESIRNFFNMVGDAFRPRRRTTCTGTASTFYGTTRATTTCY